MLAIVTGKVFEDRNKKGIPNVVVSDGKSVTKTDGNGRYILRVDPERRNSTIVFVTLPEGYTVPADAANTPQFFARIEGLKAGETREQDITLIYESRLEGKEGRFIAINDTHVSKYGNSSINIEKERFINQIKQLNRFAHEVD